jgi:hypothetical protein
VEVYPSQQVVYWVLSSDEEEVEKVALPVEEYQPSDLSEEKTIRRAIEENELLELGQWVGLGELQASVSTSCASASTMLGFDANNKKKILRNLEFPKDLSISNIVTVNISLETYPHRPNAGITLPHKR